MQPTGSSPIKSRIATPLSTPEKVKRTLKSKLHLPDDEIHQFSSAIFAQQKQLIDSGLEGATLYPSDEFPYSGVITQEAVAIIGKKIGTGSQSEVFSAQYFPTKRHRLMGVEDPCTPSTCYDKAVKRPRLPDGNISTACRRLNRALQLDENTPASSVEAFDIYQKTISIPGGQSYSIHELFTSDLLRANFHKSPTPILDITRAFIYIAKGLERLHTTNTIHRDVKGANILLKRDEHGQFSRAALTDFDFAMTEHHSYHKVSGTRAYLDLTQFGHREECLAYQKVMQAIQVKHGDVYALGVTLSEDVILRLLSELGSNTDKLPFELMSKADVLLNKMNSREIHGTFTQQDLLTNGEIFGYSIYVPADATNPYDRIIIPPPLQEFYINLIHLCNLLGSCFASEAELDALIDLASLACEMRNPKPHLRPKIAEVRAKLETIHVEMTSSQQAIAQSSGLS